MPANPTAPAARLVVAAAGLMLATALIGGCSKKTAESSSTTTSTTTTSSAPAATPAVSAALAAAAGGPTTPITAAQMPAPKAGLWERVSTQDAEAPITDRKCVAGKPMDPMADGPPCKQVEYRRTATGGVVVDAACPNNGVTAKLHMTAEGDFNSAYVTESTMTMSMAGSPDNTMKNHSTYKYVGACPAG